MIAPKNCKNARTRKATARYIAVLLKRIMFRIAATIDIRPNTLIGIKILSAKKHNTPPAAPMPHEKEREAPIRM
jgi:hypothetical protein